MKGFLEEKERRRPEPESFNRWFHHVARPSPDVIGNILKQISYAVKQAEFRSSSPESLPEAPRQKQCVSKNNRKDCPEQGRKEGEKGKEEIGESQEKRQREESRRRREKIEKGEKGAKRD